MRVLIVDDEPAARQRLAIMLEELDVEVVGEAENGLRALEIAEERHPDLILLDITMPEVDGFDVARHLPTPKPLIVFQTAFDEYALKAFEHEAVDYLVKPVTMERLQQALERAAARITDQKRPQLTHDLIEQLRTAVHPNSPTHTPRLLVRARGGHALVPFHDVLSFRAKEGVVFVKTTSGERVTDYTLTELEERTQNAFVRPNRAELVNIDHIASISSNGDGSASLVISDNSSVHVTRRRTASIRSTLKG